ncbi:hypothetical protein C1645_742063 [Glomus cerebriforme]|uniref:Uncharacterized protein n=1 Tax=Glomus cerebriforme TaxID=658196 RepID=A0A397SLE4_9GLOM|nr:hypothetical protein C1645_742063 [Glomus cerebriforme]
MDKKIEFINLLILTLLMIMASIHTLVKSILIYRTHVSKSSKLVMIFLVWKLRQFAKSKKHDYFGCVLLLTRSLFYIIYIAFLRPQITFEAECDNNINNGRIFLLAAIITDLLIVAYVAFRFVRYTRRIANSSQTDQHIPFSSKSIIWDALRISITSILHINNINIVTLNDSTISRTIQIIVIIALLYLITFDLVKLDNPTNGEGSEVDIERPISHISETSISSEDIILRASNGMLANMPLKNVRDEIKMEQQYNIVRLEPDGDIGVLQQPLSFYEVASIFLGKKNKKRSSI